MTAKERYLKTIACQRPDRVPVTPIFMAWAAHHINKTYREFYLDGTTLVEAQAAITQLFKCDQIGVVSDPWREASAYGMEFDYPEDGVGRPRHYLLQSPQDIVKLIRINFATAY